MLLATPAANRSRACVSVGGGQIARLGRHVELLAAGLQVEERRADVVVDRRFHVVGLGAAGAQIGVGLEQPAALAAALEDRDVERADDVVGGARVAGVRPMSP